MDGEVIITVLHAVATVVVLGATYLDALVVVCKVVWVTHDARCS